MASEYDLITEQGFSAYLTSQDIAHTSIALLTGGTANYVYRVTLPSGETTIYKHAAPYLHSNTSFAFDPKRMDYEDRVLEILPALLEAQLPESSVHAVHVSSYDRERKVLRLEDGGSRHLKDAYEDLTLDIPKIGAELGRWIAAVHLSTRSTSLSLVPSEDPDLKANNMVAVRVYRHSYSNLHAAFAEYMTDDADVPRYADFITPPSDHREIEFARQINDGYGSRLAHENECVCHGDFWPGNVLVQPTSTTTSTSTGCTLTVVDWEIASLPSQTRRGTSATDVAQFCAEAFLLDRFRGNRGLLPSFLNAYLASRWEKDRGGLGKEWFRRMAVHWGVHVAFWPTRVQWTDREGTRQLVEIGARVLRAAVEGKWGALFSSEVFRDVEVRFKDVF